MRTIALVVFAGSLVAAEPKDSYAFRMRSSLLAADQTRDTNVFTVRSFNSCSSPCISPSLHFNEVNATRRHDRTFYFKPESVDSNNSPGLGVVPPPIRNHNKVFFFKSDDALPAAPARDR